MDIPIRGIPDNRNRIGREFVIIGQVQGFPLMAFVVLLHPFHFLILKGRMVGGCHRVSQYPVSEE
jgi:hypothetical protein